MTGRRAINLVFSYAHKDEAHHGLLSGHLSRMASDRKVDGLEIKSWDDREIPAGANWDEEIHKRFGDAQIILLLLSPTFLEREYIKEKEIPQAQAQAEAGTSILVPVILEKCDWQNVSNLDVWQAIPTGATPIVDWPHRDEAYQHVARRILALVESLVQSRREDVERERTERRTAIFHQYPFRVLGENYDPFRAFEQIFRRAENHQLLGLPPLPLKIPLGNRIVFDAQSYRAILTELRHGDERTGLPYDLAAIPYPLLGHCVEAGLLQPLDSDLNEHASDFAWWHEMGDYEGELYGVPLSALTMVLAIRADLFDSSPRLVPPDTWEDYLKLLEDLHNKPILDPESGRPVAPGLLQGRCHITLWYDWLNYLYAHSASDREIYGGNRFSPTEAAATLRNGTLSYLRSVARLAPYADGNSLPHYATANWDDGIDQFAEGKLLMQFMFNDALETQRMRLKGSSTQAGKGSRVKYLPVPRAIGSKSRYGHVEGWVLCVPKKTHYQEAANAILRWFLDLRVQREYVNWGGPSSHRTVIEEQAARDDDAGAGSAYWESTKASLEAEAVVNLVKYKRAGALAAIDRVKEDLYDAVLLVARGVEGADAQTKETMVQEATEKFLKKIEVRLLQRGF